MRATADRWTDEPRADATVPPDPAAWHAGDGVSDADHDGPHDPQDFARLAPAGFETEIVGY